ncbi:ABC transporter A family member 2-like [Dorcoceras hygrometricum]|uniref:ABC transporter A family member 2-like n=1 Tax=Dorcoceras hygrometricum TaxID=472368 RepID=A0A2Z7B8Y3_9LAMI|nr:ABC transporter A family member 2-like [Dorcoceras hygrometricum]
MIVDSFASGSFSLCWCTVQPTSTPTALQSSSSSFNNSSLNSLCSNSILYFVNCFATGCLFNCCDWILCAWLQFFATSAFLASGFHVDWICNSTVSYDWIHCSSRLLPAGFIIANHQLNLNAKEKRCRINLFKRHRFAIANFEYARLVALFLFTSMTACATADLSSSADYNDVTDYIIIDGPLRCSSWFPFLLLALATGSYRSNWFTMLQLVQIGLRLITNN